MGANKALEAAIAASMEATNILAETKLEASNSEQAGYIQSLVDERQAKRVCRDFDAADKIEREPNNLGVQVNNRDLSWTGPNGLYGAPQRQAPPPPKGKGKS